MKEINEIKDISNKASNNTKIQEEVIMIDEARSLHVLAHTLEVVELQEKVLQRKLEVTQQEDEQAKSLAILFGKETLNYPTNITQELNKLE
jgi:enolase